MRISDWSSDVCSSDLAEPDAEDVEEGLAVGDAEVDPADRPRRDDVGRRGDVEGNAERPGKVIGGAERQQPEGPAKRPQRRRRRIHRAVAAGENDRGRPAVTDAPAQIVDRLRSLAADRT